jgi:hypothetical protein
MDFHIIHLMTATTVSMIITLVFYYGLEETRESNSLFQHIFIDTVRDYLLFICCLLDNWQSMSVRKMNSIIYIFYLFLVNDTCKYYWDNTRYIKVIIFSLVVSLKDLPIRYPIEPVKKNIEPLVFTLFAVGFVARFCNALSFRCQIDVFTVFFLMWQFTFLIYKWYTWKLPWFSFTLHQTSLCTYMAFISYAFYDMVLRYFPVRYKFGFLWFLAIKDW